MVWLLQDRKVVISRNVVFREELLYKDVILDRGKGKVQDQSETKGGIRTTIEIVESSKSSSGNQTEGGADQAEAGEEHTTVGDPEDLSNYQLARDRVRRVIVKPASSTGFCVICSIRD